MNSASKPKSKFVSYETFRAGLIGLVIILAGLMGYYAVKVATKPSTSTPQVSTPASAPSTTSTRSATANNSPSTENIRARIEQWLGANQDRQGKMKHVDILPSESYRATAIRFAESDAAKFTSDSRHWSQIKLDLNRDGKDDEKWLLKNGRTYKREVLDGSGRTMNTEYFN